MPRAGKTKSKATADKRLRQKSLLDFTGDSSRAKPTASSSKTAMASKSSPVRSRDILTKRKRRRAASVDSDDGAGSSSDVAAIHFEPRPAIEISDSDDELRPRRLRKKYDGFSFPPPVHRSDMDSDMDEVPSPKKKRLVKQSAMATLSDSSESEEHEPSPKRRKLAKGKRPISPRLSDDSGDEVDEAQILDSRLRKRGKQSSFQKNLEKLKKRRGGHTAVNLSEEESEEGDEDEADGEDASVPFFGARRDDTEDVEEGSSHQSRNDEDDFIVEDDSAAADLPTAFSMTARQDPAHLFKIVCQLFVHLAVRPARERHDYMEHILKSDGPDEQYFAVPLVMTRNKLSGLRDSVASSVWRPALKKALMTFPDFSLSRLDFAVQHCDACHLGGRLSTFMGRASGQPYDRDSFEPIEKPSDEEDSSDEEEDADEAKEFNLGRFCAARVQVFHRFAHWEYSLFEAITNELGSLRGDNNKFVRVSFWKGLQPPEDLSDADGIMDWLDQRGFIQMEWQRIKDMMNSASKLEGGRENDDDLDVN